MDSLYTPTLFTRQNRPLHTLWLEAKAWFCAHELGRMTGRFSDEHCIRQADGAEDVPRLGQMCWPGGRTATLLYWQSEPWVRMRDMPVVMAGEVAEPGALVKRKMSWRECAQRALRMHGM